MAEKVNGKCRLCLTENVDLIGESHIIPRFIYKRTNIFKASRKVWTQTSSWNENPEDARRVKTKIGLYEKHILCRKCEDLLMNYEHYASTIWDDLINFDNHQVSPDGQTLIRPFNVDYQKFKIFILSIFWRAAISKQAKSANRFTEVDKEKLRLMILTGNPGRAYEFPIVVSIIPKIDQGLDFIAPPCHLDLISSLMIISKLMIDVYFDNWPMANSAEMIKRFMLKEDGFLLSDIADDEVVLELYKKLLRMPERKIFNKMFGNDF